GSDVREPGRGEGLRVPGRLRLRGQADSQGRSRSREGTQPGPESVPNRTQDPAPAGQDESASRPGLLRCSPGTRAFWPARASTWGSGGAIEEYTYIGHLLHTSSRMRPHWA